MSSSALGGCPLLILKNVESELNYFQDDATSSAPVGPDRFVSHLYQSRREFVELRNCPKVRQADRAVRHRELADCREHVVIGDTVNLAARLESANRVYDTQILLGETTAEALGPHFETRELDTIAVKGKTESTRIFELLGPAGQVPENVLRLREIYSQALLAYRAQDWDGAEIAFRACLELQPNDGPAALLLKRTDFAPEWRGYPLDQHLAIGRKMNERILF